MRLLAFFLLLALFPVLALLWCTLFFTSRSPVIFKQKRVGLHKSPFTIFKFTTMEGGHVTWVGRYLRCAGLDELPQLINVIRNEVALVGPRPLTQEDITRLGWEASEYEARWQVKPGITGMAQLMRVCDAKLSIQYDLAYVKKKKWLLDVKILLRSLLVPFFGKSKM